MTIDEAKRAFTKIYEEEHDALFRFCYFRVSDRERAIDLTQEAFTKLWLQLALGKGVENSRAFLYAISRNLIIDWYRRVKSVSLESLSEGGDRHFDAPDVEGAIEIERSSDAKRVVQMINKMSDNYKDVVYLRFVEDLPPSDIAEMLNMSVNAVSIRITRGLEELRKSLGIEESN